LRGRNHDHITSGIAEEEALKKGMEEKSKEFVEKGAEVYAKA
jgi:phosphomethylpyrimidine synthase